MRHRPLIVLLALFLALGLAPFASASGLLVPQDRGVPPLRITQHAVDVTIDDRIARTELTQTFRNDTRRRLEATYVFPIPEDADLTDFQMSFNGKMVQGEVLPAAQAKAIYEQIVRQARDPGLIEFIGRRLLRMRVFPIEPNSDTTISIRYQQINRPTGAMMAYHYPLRTRQASGQVHGTVRFQVTLHTPAALKNVWSPSHAVEIVRDGEHNARIAYEASGGSLDDDFLLLYGTDESDLGLSAVSYRPDAGADGHFVLMLTPRQLWPESDRQPQDVVFVLDTSGSMAGAKIDQARRALGYCVNSLDERDRFSVVRFSTGFDVLYETPQLATPERREKARAWVSGFRAAGGTNIGDTLHRVMAMQPAAAGEADERPFVIVFLTDGMGNREAEEVMSMVRGVAHDPARVRLFPFGVGDDVNTMLLDRLSADFKGRPTYVQPGENLELVLGDFFGVISQPVLTNLRLRLPGIEVSDQFPPVLGDLYHGQQLIVAGRFARSVEGPVSITAQRNGQRVEYRWPGVRFAHTAEADYVPSVWAGRKIAYLIDQIRRHGESPEMVKEIVELSQAHGIQTPYASWFVNPEGIAVPGLTFRGGREQARRLGGTFGIARDRAGGGGGGGGNIFDEPSAASAPGVALREVAGKSATAIARANAGLRGLASADEARVDEAGLVVLTIEGRLYNRLGEYLVDQTIDDTMTIHDVQFASEAYFELIAARPALRPVLARQALVGVVVGDGVAVLIRPDAGIESFSDEQRQQIGLDVRSSS